MRRLSFSALLSLVVVLLLTCGAVAQSPSPSASTESGSESGSESGLPLTLSVRGSPLLSDVAGNQIRATVKLDRPVDDLQLWVAGYGGNRIRSWDIGRRGAGTLTRSWNGRDRRGEPVANGPYRIVAIARDGDVTHRAASWVTVADRKVYPRRPGAITVVVDPGHGGSRDGAVGKDGTREADINLDIGLRLSRMLEGAGIDVVTTRTTDTDVNEPGTDLTSDGAANYDDELAARPDIAKLIQHESLTGGPNLSRIVHGWLRPIVTAALEAIEKNPDSVWSEDERPLAVSAWIHVILGHFAMAPLNEALFDVDPLSPDELERQKRFLRRFAAIMMSSD
jgi:N-acetylmuramoyl-L-alanine amidase